MKYLLDTNICIYFFRGKYNIKERINTAGIENCAISEITLAELVYGAEHSSNPKKNHELIADLTEQIAIISIFDSRAWPTPVLHHHDRRLRQGNQPVP